ncbi:MAG: complex I subunit 1 family protein [Planctomycetota bacterium]
MLSLAPIAEAATLSLPSLALPQFLLDLIPQPVPAQLLVSAITLIVVVHVILGAVAYCIYAERKISAYIQDRLGPNRTGFDFGLPFLSFLKGAWGLGQPLADGVKFLLKEDYTPASVDKVLFTLAPAVIIVPALIGFAIIPWGGAVEIPPFELLGIAFAGGEVVVAGAAVNAGVIYLLAVASLGVYGVTLGGWASNNKYSFLGGLRATAQMVSYELPLGMSLLAVLLLTGSLIPMDIIGHQAEHGWNILAQPIAAVLFFIAILAEANRAPFDNAEAEQELVGGYHTEYSSMRFALYFLAEYAHMITSSAFFALLFMGGFHMPGIALTDPEAVGIGAVIAKLSVYAGKTTILVLFMMVVRWTLPRLRYDQIMTIAWQGMIPVALAVVVLTSVMVYLELTSLVPMLLANIGLAVLLVAIQPALPSSTTNHRIRLYGSRFSPVEGSWVSTTPTEPMAREDRPIQGTVPTS